MPDLLRYDVMSDELIPVTQEWVDGIQRLLRDFGSARRAAERAIAVQDNIVVEVCTHPALREFLASWRPEFEQK